jgi:hypothetical protein
MFCGNGADWKCVLVVLGMGEADCDFDSNFYCHYISSLGARLVAREVAKV